MKNIIIVAPEQYQDLARKITHEISKQPGFTAAYWTIKHYADNEFQLTGNQYVVLMGNSDENRFTKDYLQVINNLKNFAGAFYGYDGAKAVIFGDGKLVLLENKEATSHFLELLFSHLDKQATKILSDANIGFPVDKLVAISKKSLINHINDTDEPVDVKLTEDGKVAWAKILEMYQQYAMSILAWGELDSKPFKYEQTKMALERFMAECFDDWAGIRKTEQGV
ncbi:MAG TPA: hypothetical protein HPP97_10270 [Desulfuromonadales bacterium]|nr:hypothetical protein [Desulfuromonadales bacterium]